MNFTDTEFSKKIKRLFALANNTRMCHWHLADIRVEEKCYSFRIKTDGFYGCIILMKLPAEDVFGFSTLTYEEMMSLSPQQVSEVANKRLVMVESKDLMKKLDAIATKVVGHRAPQCVNIPQGNR